MKKIIVANWKMYLSPKNSVEFLGNLPISQSPNLSNIELIICPSFTVLSAMKSRPASLPVHLGAQNCFWKERGAFTGEISPADLRELGCEYVIIGHSERRQYFGETNVMVNQKLLAALAANLTPIFCLGETAAEREADQAQARVVEQLQQGLAGIKLSASQNLIIAYEPIWAIGTGNFCQPEEAAAMHELIKEETWKLLGRENAAVLYGGSVDEKNAAAYLTHPKIDGVLVGGASAKPEIFSQIISQLY